MVLPSEIHHRQDPLELMSSNIQPPSTFIFLGFYKNGLNKCAYQNV
jgi:hypothetical protein